MTDIPNRPPWINLVVGILTIIAPFALSANPATRWALVIGGLVIAIVAIIELNMASHHKAGYWPVINMLAGIWLLIATSMAGNTAIVWNEIVLGITAIVTAITSLSYDRMYMTGHHPV